MLTRRQFIKGFALTSAAAAACGGYAFAEPFRLAVTRYRLTPPRWPQGLNVKIAVLADLHACDPWMTGARVAQIVRRTNALGPDVTLLLGDYVVGYRLSQLGRKIGDQEWAEPLGELKAPLGVHGVLGNHDWWEDHGVQHRRQGPPRVRRVLEDAGINVMENDALRIEKDGQGFWIAGLGDQWAFWPRDRKWRGRREIPYQGVDDVPAMLRQITDQAPVITMAHEPDAFAKMPEQVSLTLSGHTHGGQVRVFGFAPIVPSRYGRRYTYGHIVERGRHLIVSGGLGCSGLPIRFGSPPEIVLLELGSERA
ncbi:MAG: metallophosphoesterase [Alphaproteobacteria bacterium]|nr:metallophosphoesterase [Alphaproteobacteria bacterium]